MDSSSINFRHPQVWAILAAVVIGGIFFVYGKTIETRDETRTTISVSGEGKAFGSPDIAEISFGVQTGRRSTAKDAMAFLERNMNAIMVAVGRAGIAEEDIRTEQFALHPAYDWEEGRQILRGYEASQMLRVKVRDLDRVSEVLSSATQAGANQAGNVQFMLEDPEELRSAAREEAIAEAKAKALKVAGDLGLRLGRLRGFSESGEGIPPMFNMESVRGMGGADSAANLPLPPGQSEVRSLVTLTYELR